MNIDLADGVLTLLLLLLLLLQTIMITKKDDSSFFGIESQQKKKNIRRRVVVAFLKRGAMRVDSRKQVPLLKKDSERIRPHKQCQQPHTRSKQ
jgi:hypothetical protein